MRAYLPLALLLISTLPTLANNPGGGTGTGANVTITVNTSASTVTMANGLVTAIINTSTSQILQLTYANTQVTTGGTAANAAFYWQGQNDWGEQTGSGGVLTVVTDPSANGGASADIMTTQIFANTATTEQSANNVYRHFTMFRGSPGIYVTQIMSRPSNFIAGDGDLPSYTCKLGSNIFNWLAQNTGQNVVMPSSTDLSNALGGVNYAPKEVTRLTSGVCNGQFDCKYDYAGDLGLLNVTGWCSTTNTSTPNIGLWCIHPSDEYFSCGPKHPEILSQMVLINATFKGVHFGFGSDLNFAAGETWTRVCGPFFLYLNQVPGGTANAQVPLYNDAVAQAAAEKSAWPYSWLNDSNYVQAAGRGTVTGKLVINDSGNPNASAANMWVGLAQQPPSTSTTTLATDFQYWSKGYQYWTKTDANGNFTIPNVISNTNATNVSNGNYSNNYTLFAFGPGAIGQFQSQALSGGAAPPVTINTPATQFSVAVNAGATTNLGTVTWTPTRVGSTVFEIGVPDRDTTEFRHGDDYWHGDYGTATNPAVNWSPYQDYGTDFPNGLSYTVGTSVWSRDWDYAQPVILDPTTGNWNSSTQKIFFTLPQAPAANAQASLYFAIAADNTAPVIVSVNNTNVTSPSTGFFPAYASTDSMIRMESHGIFCDYRMSIAANLLKAGLNEIDLNMRKGGYFADGVSYDYIRMELTGYIPPAPASLTAYAGNAATVLNWPPSPGATSYNILRSTTSGSGYTTLATNVTGPTSGSTFLPASYTDTTAANGTPYYYVVQAVNPNGASANSTQASATPTNSAPGIPSAPTGLAASNSAQVQLTWNASTGAAYYLVERSDTTGGPYTPVSGSLTGTTYIDTGVRSGSTYYYVVVAVNATGVSPTSTEVNTRPLPTLPSNTPGSLIATNQAGQVYLTWSLPVGVTNYFIQSSTTSTGPYAQLSNYDVLTDYTDTTVLPNTTYYYEVAGANLAGLSPYAGPVSITTPPATPANVTAYAGNSQVTLTWTPSTAATSYTVSSGTVTGGPYTTIGTTAGPSFTNSGLTNGTTYYYVVSASDANGTSANSTEVNATPVATLPLAPTGLTVAPGYKQTVVNWTASSGATSYTLLRAPSTGGPYTIVASGLTGTNYTDPNLGASTTYYYVVEAINAAGTSAYSTEANGTTTNTPTNLVWTGTLSDVWDQATANWTGGGNPAIYNDSNDDTVTFGDSASTSTVVVSGTVTPFAMIFNNSALTYTVSGGTVTGSGTMTQMGTGTVVINNVNTLSGDVDITSGVLNLGATGTTGGSVGTGTIYLGPGSTLQMGSAGHNFPNDAIALTNGANATLYSASISNGYGGVFSGTASSTLTLSGGVSFGSTGTAQLAGFSGVVFIPAGSQLRFASTSGANGNGGGGTSFLVNGSLYTRNAGGAGGVVLGALSGTGTLQGASNSTGAVTYFIGGANLNSTFSGVIANGSDGPTTLTKIGTGTLTLSGSNSYTGVTAISGGTLAINGSLASSSIVTVSGTTTLAGTGTLNGKTTVASSGTLSPGNGGSGTLTFDGGLALSGGSGILYNLGAPGSSDLIALSGSYTPPSSGTVTINLSALSGFGSGTYTLVRGASAISASSFTVGDAPSGYTYALNAASGTLSLVVSGAPAAPTNLIASASGASIALQWIGSTGATSYNVARGTVTGGPYGSIGSVSTGTYTDANLSSGTYYYVVTAQNNAGISGVSNEASATVQTAFQQWLSTNGLPTTTSPSATPDNDQTSLLMKYATGLTPGSPSAAGPAAISSSGDHLVLQFDRLSPPPVNYLVEWSTDLVNWNSLATLASGATNWTGSATVAESGTSPVLVSVTDTASLANGTTPRFLRMRVTTSTDTLEPPTIPQGDVPISFTGSTTNATSLMLDNAPVSRNAITAVATSSLTVVNAGSWATTGAPYALRLLSGTGAGETYVITAQSGNVLTLSTQGVDLTQVVAVGDLYEILPLETLGLLYGTTSTALQTGGSATAADNVLFWNGSTWLTYFNNGSGWMRSGSLLSQNNALIPAGAGYMVQRRGASVLKYEIIGRVPEVALSQFSTSGGLAFLGATYPLSSTLGATNFVNTPTWLTGSSATSADNVLIWNGSTWLTFYLNGTTWYRSGNLLSQGSFALPVGTPLMIQRRSTPSAFNAFITQPLPYSPFTP